MMPIEYDPTPTTYPTTTGVYYERFDALPTPTLLHLLSQIRHSIRQGEHLNLEFADGVLGAVALKLRDASEGAGGAAEDAPDGRLDVAVSAGHSRTVGPAVTS